LIAALTEALRASAVAPEGLDAAEAATLCGISRAAFYGLNRRGLVPAPVQIGDGPRRWLRSELLAWLRQGCPSRRMWAQIREQAMRRAG
jgi:predicted DNA-binding transcriptional regulator AlpA